MVLKFFFFFWRDKSVELGIEIGRKNYRYFEYEVRNINYGLKNGILLV